MKQEVKRVTDEFSAVLTQNERQLIEARRKALKAISEREGKMAFRETDNEEFKRKVHETAESLTANNFGTHILYRSQPDLIRGSLLFTELAEGWDIDCASELDPEAAKALIETHETTEFLPPEAHRLNFPLFMSGYLIGHSTRVAIYSALLAQKANEAGYPEKVDPKVAILAGLFHDIGKLEPQLKQLVKMQGRFNPKQLEMVKAHTTIGFNAFRALFEFKNGRHLPVNPAHFGDIAKTIQMHHVRPDKDPNRSYPDNVHPDETNALVRMVAIADTFDAITSRNYDQNPMVQSHRIRHAYDELKDWRDKQVDGELADLFCELKPIPIIK